MNTRTYRHSENESEGRGEGRGNENEKNNKHDIYLFYTCKSRGSNGFRTAHTTLLTHTLSAVFNGRLGRHPRTL